MKEKLKKVLCIGVSFFLLAGMATGCVSKKDTSDNTDITEQTTDVEVETSAKSETSDDEPEWKSDTSPITFTAFIDWPGWLDSFEWGKDKVTKEITRRTGVTIDVERATTSDSQQLNLMLASDELTDFVVVGLDSPARTILWKQGFVQPLNELMDKYCPKMWDVLPEDMDTIYTEDDGNLYLLTSWFADVERIKKLKDVPLTEGSFSINKTMYEDIGSPPMNTLDEYREALLTVKQKYPNVFPLYDGAPGSSKIDSIINRVYGGSPFSIDEDGTVHLEFTEETYLKAVKYINELYREGLYDPEIFTMKSEQVTEIFKNNKVFSHWGQSFYAFSFDMDGPFWPFKPPTEPSIPFRLPNVATSIGTGATVFISNKCSNPERAIKYLEFMMSDEGQLLMGYGIEGEDYILDLETLEYEEGAVKYTQQALDLMQDWGEYVETIGAYNDSAAWIINLWTDKASYYWLNQQKPKYKAISDIFNKYAVDERIFNLMKFSSDSEENIIQTKIKELWNTSRPLMYLADSEEECVENYREFVKQAEKLGLDKVEKELTKLYTKWNTKLEN